jgi:MFS family permease
MIRMGLATQNLLWGLGLPFAGAIADKFGAPRVLSAGAAMYALGLYLTSSATDPAMLHVSAGVLIGFGLSGCAVPTVIGALGKVLPDSWRLIAFGAIAAAGSFGQFLFSPLAVYFIDSCGWQNTLVIFSGLMLLVIPHSNSLDLPVTEWINPRAEFDPRSYSGRFGAGPNAASISAICGCPCPALRSSSKSSATTCGQGLLPSAKTSCLWAA